MAQGPPAAPSPPPSPPPSSLKMRTEKLFVSFGENLHPVLHCPDMNLVVTHCVNIIRVQSHGAGINRT